jgi:hypothetical protein
VRSSRYYTGSDIFDAKIHFTEGDCVAGILDERQKEVIVHTNISFLRNQTSISRPAPYQEKQGLAPCRKSEMHDCPSLLFVEKEASKRRNETLDGR